MALSLPDLMRRFYSAVTTSSNGSNAGLVVIDGLSNSFKRISATTYNTTNIKGYRILNIGTGTLTLSPSDGSTDIVITNAELVLMGDSAYLPMPDHLDSITAGVSMEVLVYL